MEGSNETGRDLNTATRRQPSADAVGFLGMLGKYTDGIRETGLDCLTEAWLALHLAGYAYGSWTVPQTLLVNVGVNNVGHE